MHQIFPCGMKVQLRGGGGGIPTGERSCSHAHLVFCFSCCCEDSFIVCIIILLASYSVDTVVLSQG